jgi:phage tail sheath protein FI
METFGETITAAEVNTEHAACYYPWINVPTSTPGVTRLIPPDGYIAAARARAHNQVGPQQAAAGLISNARWVVSTETEIDQISGNTLDVALVNALRVINGALRIYGARSLSSDTSNFRYITGQDTVNGVVTEANQALEDLIFATIDGRNTVFTSVEAKLIAILEPLRLKGALYEAFDSNGKQIDKGYTVICNSSINPVTQLADGLVKAKVGLRVSSVGDKIEVDIVKSNLTNSVV